MTGAAAQGLHGLLRLERGSRVGQEEMVPLHVRLIFPLSNQGKVY